MTNHMMYYASTYSDIMLLSTYVTCYAETITVLVYGNLGPYVAVKIKHCTAEHVSIKLRGYLQLNSVITTSGFAWGISFIMLCLLWHQLTPDKTRVLPWLTRHT